MKTIATFPLVISAFFFTCFAQAYPIGFSAILASDAPGATGSGSVMLEFDEAAHTLSIDTNWAGLSGTTTVAHIHCCTALPQAGTAGIAVTPSTLPGFPVGLHAGSYSIDLDLTQPTTYTTGFFNISGGGNAAGAETALLAGLRSGSAYFNIHSSTFPGGEIRGFPQAVPEPMPFVLFAVGLLGLFFAQHRRAAVAVKV